MRIEIPAAAETISILEDDYRFYSDAEATVRYLERMSDPRNTLVLDVPDEWIKFVRGKKMRADAGSVIKLLRWASANPDESVELMHYYRSAPEYIQRSMVRGLADGKPEKLIKEMDAKQEEKKERGRIYSRFVRKDAPYHFRGGTGQDVTMVTARSEKYPKDRIKFAFGLRNGKEVLLTFHNSQGSWFDLIGAIRTKRTFRKEEYPFTLIKTASFDGKTYEMYGYYGYEDRKKRSTRRMALHCADAAMRNVDPRVEMLLKDEERDDDEE